MINVIGVLDKKFVQPYILTFYSILKNANDIIDFHLIYNDLVVSDFHLFEEKLSSLKKPYRISFEKIPENYRSYLFDDFKQVTTHCTNNTFMKIYIPEYCKKNNISQNVIYIDGDFLFFEDISLLHNSTDLKNIPIGAVSFPWYAEGFHNYSSKLNLPFDTKFFNAGLMVLNLEYFNTVDFFKIFKDFVSEFYPIINGDQVCWNGIFKGDIIEIDYLWNIPYRTKVTNTKRTTEMGKILLESWEEAKAIHFCAPEKPWSDTFYMRRKDKAISVYNETWKEVFGSNIQYTTTTKRDNKWGLYPGEISSIPIQINHCLKKIIE